MPPAQVFPQHQQLVKSQMGALCPSTRLTGHYKSIRAEHIIQLYGKQYQYNLKHAVVNAHTHINHYFAPVDVRDIEVV